ncbi:MAG: ATP-binding protein [Planctomycetota bacterium]
MIQSEDVKLRVFQRNFSTKADNGRGLGTFSMKLFGEKFLGGSVTFVSTEEEGTVFKLTLPLKEHIV